MYGIGSVVVERVMSGGGLAPVQATVSGGRHWLHWWCRERLIQ